MRDRMMTELAGVVVGRQEDLGRPLLVAVDGVDGAGKTTLADELAAALSALGAGVRRGSVDGFHHPRAHRHAAGRSAESVWSRHFDYDGVRRHLVDPWRYGAGASYRPALHDVATDAPLDDVAEVPERGILVVDGVFLQRPELADAWDVVIFVDVPFEVSVPRMAARDGTDPDPDHPDQRRYVDAQRRYLADHRPRERADVVIDNHDLSRPALSRRSPGLP